MGCIQSKFDTKLIKFCRERKVLIKALRDSWHSLSHAHASYVQSLQNVENGIKNFMIETLLIRFKSPLDTVSVNQTVEEVPRSNDSSLESIENDGDIDPSHCELENASCIFSEEESSSFLEEPETPPKNITSFIDQPHNRYSHSSLNYSPDNLYYPPTSYAGFYNSSGFDFPHLNQIQFDEMVHSMPSDFTNQQRNLPSPHDTTWENINPFNSFEEFFPNLYSHGTYETSLGDINEVREMECIPGLEYELCDSHVSVSSTEEESEAKPSKESNDSLSDETTNNGHDFHQNVTEVQEDSQRRYPSPQVDEYEQNSTSMHVRCLTNLHDILACINEVFDTLLIHGKDVLGMLKPFEPRVSLIERSSSKGTSILRRVMLQKQTYRKLKYEYNEKYGKETCAKLCSLSWTLEKLYAWEKKLYDELKEEEKLREILEKEQKKLNKLDTSGAESVKIDASKSSMKRVTPKMNVSLSKIESISTTIHGIMCDELQPQLCEYIRGLQKLSKLSFESQQKRVQSITISLANIDTVTCRTNSSSQRVTKKLATEVIKLETTFACWINSHKEFVVLLKQWLLKFQEQSEVPDSNPLNVSTICEDWLKALEKVSRVDLPVALQSFSLVLHQLSENLHEERRHRLRLQHFSNYHEQKLKRLCKENGVDYEQCKSLFREAELIGGISGDSSLDALYIRLRPVREKVGEASVKHGEAVNRVNNTVTGIFQNGIGPVLAAMERFNFEMFTAYEQFRTLSEGSVQ